ncbi:hypothetical protein CX680_31370, partial [Klebsiella pneumoniae]
TWPAAIAAISGRVQRNPQTIEIDTVDALPAIEPLLFLRTWPAAIAAISGRVQRNPQTIEIDTVDALPAIE